MSLHSEALAAALAHDPRSPGKFEAESPATVYFYVVGLDGGGDEEIGSGDCGSGFLADLFRISEEEAAQFGLPPTDPWYVVSVDSQGFVSGYSASEEEAQDLRASCDRETDREEV